MWGFDHGGGLMGFGMILLWLLPIALLVWLFAQFAGSRKGPDGRDAPPRAPREILDARYARGEIDRDEYLARRTDLEQTRQA